MLIVEIGMDMGVFGMVDCFVLWIGLCLGNNIFVGKSKKSKI